MLPTITREYNSTPPADPFTGPTRLALLGHVRGLTPADLAAKSGVSLATVGQVWRGGEAACTPALEVYERLAVVLGLPPHVLLRNPCPRCLATDWGPAGCPVCGGGDAA